MHYNGTDLQSIDCQQLVRFRLKVCIVCFLLNIFKRIQLCSFNERRYLVGHILFETCLIVWKNYNRTVDIIFTVNIKYIYTENSEKTFYKYNYFVIYFFTFPIFKFICKDLKFISTFFLNNWIFSVNITDEKLYYVFTKSD